MAMRPALHSWRDKLSAALVRVLAYLGGVAVLSTVAARIFQTPAVTAPINSGNHSHWIEIERPFPHFALSAGEAESPASSSPKGEIFARAPALAPAKTRRDEPLTNKFGTLSIIAFD